MASIYRNIIRPLVFRADAEKVHELGMTALRTSLATSFARGIASRRFRAPEGLSVKCFGLGFENPVGIAAGFDKNAVAVDQLCALGFGFVEVGTVTLEPQPGNPRPRLFRLPFDQAIINRLGFNNAGASYAVESLRSAERKCVVGINIGKNKDVPNEEAEQNYIECFETVVDEADYIVVNVSSPNTPGLRDLQETNRLDSLLQSLIRKNVEHAEKNENGGEKPLLLKIAPDLDPDSVDEIVDVCLERGVDGIIATNTTISRENLKTPKSKLESIGAGGLSGMPIRNLSDGFIKRIYTKTDGRLPIIGVGGVFSAEDAFEKIASGASLVQGYTGFVYRGPAYASEINIGLKRILDEKGFGSVEEARGSGV